MASSSPVKKPERAEKSKKSKKSNKLKVFDLSHIEINFFDMMRAMENGKVRTVIDSSSGETCLITEKLYRQLCRNPIIIGHPRLTL